MDNPDDPLNGHVRRAPVVATVVVSGFLFALTIPCVLLSIAQFADGDNWNVWMRLYAVGMFLLAGGGIGGLIRSRSARWLLLVGGLVETVFLVVAVTKIGWFAVVLSAPGLLGLVAALSGKLRLGRDDADDAAEAQLHKTVLTKAVAICALPLAALFALLGLLSLSEDAVAGLLVSAANATTVLASIATLVRHKFAYALWLAAGFFTVILLAQTPGSIEESGYLVVVMLPTLVGTLLAATGKLDVEMNGRDPVTLARPIKVVGGLLVFLGAVLFLLREDILQVRDDIRRAHWDEVCRTEGDQHACGYWALYTVFDSSDYDELRGAWARWNEICDAGVPRACRLLTYATRWNGQWWLLHENKPKLAEARVAMADKVCEQGEPGACAIRALMDEEPNKVAEGHCKQGDHFACWVDVEETTKREDMTGDVALKEPLCKAGFKHFCPALPPCAEAPGEPCMHELPKTAKESWNELFYGLRVDGEGHSAACDSGAAEACFDLGLNVTADVNPFNEPVPVRSLELTMGRACSLGYDVACRVFALRLLDRPVGEQADEKLAGELLDTACQRDDTISCWWKVSLLGPLEVDLAAATPLAEAACKAGGSNSACYSYVRLRAAQLEVDPYAFLGPIAARVGYRGCELGSARSCQLAGALTLERTDHHDLPFLIVRAASAAERGCAGGEEQSCRQLLWLADTTHHRGFRDPGPLREKICPQMPEVCEGRDDEE